jgi:dTMP kinase
MQNRRGCFITLEGLDGAGKSTHVQWLVDQLKDRGFEVVSTREPVRTEALLMFAARCEHVHSVILPALERGAWVVCDRFTDASYAYQGGGRQLGEQAVRVLENWALDGLEPDRSWLFDVPLAVARERLSAARLPDRFEQEEAAFFERTRQAYHERAAQQPERLHIIDSTLPVQAIRVQLEAEIDMLVRSWKAARQDGSLI